MVAVVRRFVGRARVAVAALGAAVVAACALPSNHVYYERVRARVTETWTTQRMADDWKANLRELPGAPPLEDYLHDYQRVDVFAGRIRRFGRTESPLVSADMKLEVGDVIELEIGEGAHSAPTFTDIAFATVFACGRADRGCLGDPDTGKALGLIKSPRTFMPAVGAPDP